MATEAQKLIGLSLTKIAQSRMNRGGISLHKNLLVATVLQKARFIFMEEAYAASYAHGQRQASAAETVPTETAAESRLQPEEELKRGCKRHVDDESESDAKRCCVEVRLQPVPPSDRADSAADRLSPPVALPREECDVDSCEEPMEVDRITSLVSVFSFGANSALEPLARLGRSVSTPDFCSAQAKELEGIQQRTALAMMV